jgi:hypothetical protein
MVVAVAQDPGLADGTIARQRSGKQIRQTTSSPEAILVDRFESERMERDLIDGILSVRSCVVSRKFFKELCRPLRDFAIAAPW